MSGHHPLFLVPLHEELSLLQQMPGYQEEQTAEASIVTLSELIVSLSLTLSA